MRIARISTTPSPASRGGPALFQLVRFWSRRWLRDDHRAPDDHALDILVLEATDAAARTTTPSVGAVAAQLGIDRSGASRLVAAAADHGYLVRRTHAADARRVELRITRSGRALLDAARRWQAAAFLDLVADWDPTDVDAFAGYLARLANKILTGSTTERRTMTIELNHTIVAVSDRQRAAKFFVDLVGVHPAKPNGPFVGVSVNDHLTLDFDDRRGAAPGHYAFLVDDATFDHVLSAADRLGPDYGSGPGAGWDRRINHLNSGRGIYVQDPDGHSYEFFTTVPV